MLKSAKLTGYYSLQDVIAFLSRIMVVNIDGQWRIAEYTKYAKTLCEKIELPILDPKTLLSTSNISP
jgi:hypothetical protein